MHDRVRHLGVVSRLFLSGLLAVGVVREQREEPGRHRHIGAHLFVIFDHIEHGGSHFVVRERRVHTLHTKLVDQLGQQDVLCEGEFAGQGAHHHAQRRARPTRVHFLGQDRNAHAKYYDLQQVLNKWQTLWVTNNDPSSLLF